MITIENIDEFLTKATVFYLSTIDENVPKCRPIGFHLLQDGTLYFGVGTFKDVYKQMIKNKNVEICACIGGKFLRYYGKAVFENNQEIAKTVLENSPGLKRIYNEETGHHLAIFHLEKAEIEMHIMSKLIEKNALI